MMRDVGKMGERQFEKWAGELGVVTNPSIEDKKGWDFFVEIPDYLHDDYHLTEYPQPIKSFVQVKSTDSKKDSVSIKLSNWRQLIQNSNPTFIVVFEFLEKSDPQNVYLIHIWEDLVKRYFERLNELDSGEELNKKQMSVSYGNDELLDSADSLSLFKGIIEHVNPHFQKYSINKTELINEYGYEDIDFSFTLNFELPEEYNDQEEYLVDFALGIVDRIKYDDLQIHNDEIAKKKIWDNFDFISISRDSIGECRYKLRTEDYSKQILLELETYLPSAVSHLVSKDKLKVLYRGDFFYFEHYMHSPKASFTIHFNDIEDKFALHRVEQLSQLIDFLKRVEKEDQELISETNINDTYEGRGKIEFDLSFDSEFESIIKPIKYTLNISEYFDIKNKVEVSLEELLEFKTLLEFMNSLISSDEKLFKLEGMWSEEEFPDKISTATPISVSAEMGEYHLYLGAIIIGKPEKEKVENGKFYFKTETQDVQILRKNVTKKELPDKVKDNLKNQIYSHVKDREDLILVNIKEEE